MWLHGFTQTRDSAGRFRSILAGGREVWTLDLPGHGTACEIAASLDETADLVADLLPDEPVDLAGYSLGGRVALHVALRHEARVRRLVVLGATRGLATAPERAERRRHDEALADHIEAVGTDEFLDEWLALPLFATLPADPIERAVRSHDAAGLANSLRCSGTGTQAWLAPLLAGLATPTLALAGSLDAKFADEARDLARTIGHGSVALVEGAGHAAHLEAPDACADLVAGFCD